MKKQLLLTFSFLLFLLLLPNISKAEINIGNEKLYNNLKGKIILRVEANGEAYYIHPDKQKMYYLGRPVDAFLIMREQGIGITTHNLERIRMPYDCSDYNPNCNVSEENTILANKQKGKIFLQVEKNGEAWYVDPKDSRRHFLGSPANAFGLMRELGLGISENDFNKMGNYNLKTYTNNEYGFEFKYPSYLEIKNNKNLEIDNIQEFRDLKNDCMTNLEFCANPTPLISLSYDNNFIEELSGDKINFNGVDFFKTTAAEMYHSESYKTKKDKKLISFTFWIKNDGLTEKQIGELLSTFKFSE